MSQNLSLYLRVPIILKKKRLNEWIHNDILATTESSFKMVLLLKKLTELIS
jgi:hypothetical protein